MRIFFAGPLTDLRDPEQTKSFYKRMADVAREAGLAYFWAFLNGTDPVTNPNVTPNQVYQTDTYELSKSNAMIAYVGEPSTGTGIEIEYAHTHHIPVYLLYKKGKKISRMLRGCPAITQEIVYETEDDCLSQLRELLGKIKNTS